MAWRPQCSGGPSTSTANDDPLRPLKVPDHELEKEKRLVRSKKQLWMADGTSGFRLVDLIETVANDVIVAFSNEKGIYERRRIPSASCQQTSDGGLSEDLCDLSDPNGATILDSLSRRYAHSVIHTNCGLFCIVLNPWRSLDLYSSSVRSLYRMGVNGSLPPHVYSVAQSALDGIASGERSQSVLITGESGSGKTENTKRIIEYIVGQEERGSQTDRSADSRILEFTQLLEAFGNAKTIHNDNSSRFGKFIRLFLNRDGKLRSAQVECYLLEKSRVVAQEKGERGFHVFYQLLSSAVPSQMRKCLHLASSKYKYLNIDSSQSIDDAREMHQTNRHLAKLGIDEETRMNVYQVTAACLLLGEIDFAERTGMDMSFVKKRDELGWVADLLGLRVDAIESALTNPEMEVHGKVVRKNQNLQKTLASASAVAKLLYERLFKWILERCNDAINSSNEREGEGQYIGVLDMAGFELMTVNSFEQLCINYTNERLQQLFNHYMFIKERKEYEEEGVEWNCENYAIDLQPTITLCDQNLGIFCLLEEECVVPNGAESRFLDKMLDKHRDHPSLSKAKHSSKSSSVKHFTISHYAGQVDYNVDRWLEKNKDTIDRGLLEVLSSSSHALLKQFFPKEELLQSRQDNSRRRSSVRPPSSNTVSFVYRQQLAILLSLLENSQSHFIRCILPNRESKPLKLDRPLVLHQLRCNGVLEGVRICRKGFPSRMTFEQFISRFRILSGDSRRLAWSGREAALCLCEEILHNKEEVYRVGRTRVLLRVGVLNELENRRGERLGELLTGLQAYARWRIEQKRLRRLTKERNVLVTVQHNVRLFSELSSWEWYRLWTRVRPFINTERTKEKLEVAEKEIERMTDELAEKTHNYMRLLEAMDRLRDELDEARKNEEEAKRREKEARDALRREKASMEEELKSGEDTLALLEKRFAEQHTKVMRMNEHLREYERANECIQMEKDELEKEVKKLTVALDRERSEKENLGKVYDDLMAKMDELEAGKDRMIEEKNTMQLEMTKLEVEREEHIDRAKRQADAINELQRSMADMTSRVARADGLVNEEKRKRKKVEASVQELKDAITEREGRIKKIKEKCEKMKEQGRDGEQRIKQLEKKLDDKEIVMKECLEQLKQAHKQKVTELNNIVDDLKRKNSKLENEKATRSMTESIFERESSIDSDYGASSGFTLRRSCSRMGALSRNTSFSSMMSTSSMSSLRTISRRQTEPILPENIPLTRSPSMVMEENRRVADLERQTQTLTTDLALAKREIDVYKTNISTLEGEKNSAVKQMRNSVQRMEEAERKLVLEEGKCSGYEVRLKKALEDVEDWRRKWEVITNEHSNEMSSTRRKMIQKIDNLEDEKRRFEQKWSAAEKSKEELAREVERLESQLDKFKEKLHEAEKCTTSQAVVGENWQSRCYAAESELQSLRDDNGILKGKITRLNRQITLLTQQDDTEGIVSHMESKMGNRENEF